jgi:hypothetical protein
MPLKNHPTDPEKYIYKSQEYNLNQISEPSTISFYKEINQSWVMRVTADRRIEVADGVDVTEAARLVLGAMEGMLDVGLRKAVLAEREACAKLCEDLPAPDIYSNTDKSMWDVTCMDCATAIRARGEQV